PSTSTHFPYTTLFRSYRAIQIHGNNVYLPAGKNIGLGGIAKGYGVNRAVDVLAKAGFADCLVDGGGDVRVSGTHDGQPWRLGIQDRKSTRLNSSHSQI